MAIRLHVTSDGEGYVKQDVKLTLKELQKKITSLKDNNFKLTSEYQVLIKDLEDFSKKYTNLEAQHRTVLLKIRDLEKRPTNKIVTKKEDVNVDELEDLKKERKQFKQDIETWRNKYNNEADGFNKTIKNLQKQNEELVNELNKLEINKTDSSQSRNVGLIKLKRELKNRDLEIEKLRIEIDNLTNLVNKKVPQNVIINEENNDESADIIVNLRKVNSSLESDLQMALTQLHKERKNLHTLKMESENDKKKINSFKSKNDELTTLTHNLVSRIEANDFLKEENLDIFFEKIIESLSAYFKSEEIIKHFKNKSNELFRNEKLEPLLENIQLAINRLMDNHKKELILSLGSVASDQEDIHKLTKLLNQSSYILNDRKYSLLTNTLKELILASLSYFQKNNTSEDELLRIENRFKNLKINHDNLDEAFNTIEKERTDLKEENEKLKGNNSTLQNQIETLQKENQLNKIKLEDESKALLEEKFIELNKVFSRSRLEMSTLASLVKTTSAELSNASNHINDKLRNAEEEAKRIEEKAIQKTKQED